MAKRKKRKKLSDPDVARLATAIKGRGPWRAKLVEQWIETLVMTLRELDRNPEHPLWPWVSEFWIRLNGVVEEILPRFEITHEAEVRHPNIPSKDSIRWHAEAVYDRLAGIRRALSDDDIILIHYCRNLCAHVYQDAFQIQGHISDPQLKEKHLVPALGREFMREELWSRIGEILKAYRYDSRAAAVTVAKKVERPVVNLLLAWRSMKAAK